MADKQQNKRTTRYSLLLWLILILLLLGASVGGAAAYLSASRGPLNNTMAVDEHPTITVDENNKITVSDSENNPLGYAVYLRAAVVVSWKNTENGNLLAKIPVEGTGKDYKLTTGTDWKEINGFYYYTKVITDNKAVPARVTLSKTDSAPDKTGYELTLQIAAQAIQALGTTDADSNKYAVEDAWDVTPQQITRN